MVSNQTKTEDSKTTRTDCGLAPKNDLLRCFAPPVSHAPRIVWRSAPCHRRHAADDATRRALVPTSRAHSVVELRDAFVSALAAREPARRKVLMVEITLIRGVNDGVDAARRVVEVGVSGVVALRWVGWGGGSISTSKRMGGIIRSLLQ